MLRVDTDTMKITTEANIAAPIDAVWRAFNNPDDIVRWDASADWLIASASNDLKVGGLLELRMTPSDGGSGSDFAAIYTRIDPNRLLEWRQLDDGRHVRVEFIDAGSSVTVRQIFDGDPTIPCDVERADWQGVLDNFARYVMTIYMP